MISLLAAAALAAAAGPGPTMTVDRLYDPACRCTKLRFSGTIPGGAANEYVAVMAQRCGYNFSTSVTGAQTREGGSWDVEWGGSQLSATYRALWRGRLSEPVRIRPPLPLELTKLPGRRYRLTVGQWDMVQDMRGRIVELQRLAGVGWTRVRRARLVADPEAAGWFRATFAVPTRGLTMRILVPARSAAPCYTAAATETWTS